MNLFLSFFFLLAVEALDDPYLELLSNFLFLVCSKRFQTFSWLCNYEIVAGSWYPYLVLLSNFLFLI
jgi:hypothetical protein